MIVGISPKTGVTMGKSMLNEKKAIKKGTKQFLKLLGKVQYIVRLVCIGVHIDKHEQKITAFILTDGLREVSVSNKVVTNAISCGRLYAHNLVFVNGAYNMYGTSIDYSFCTPITEDIGIVLDGIYS